MQDRNHRSSSFLCSAAVALSMCTVPAFVNAQVVLAAPPAPGVASAASAPVISAEARAALGHLLQIPAPGGAAPPVAPAATVPTVATPTGPRMQVVVRPGETLDRVIQRTLRDSPFRVELLRDAYMRLNRGAFPRGTPHWLLAGSVLQVPTLADVAALVDPRWWPAPAAAATGTTPSSGDRRSWVRYP